MITSKSHRIVHSASKYTQASHKGLSSMVFTFKAPSVFGRSFFKVFLFNEITLTDTFNHPLPFQHSNGVNFFVIPWFTIPSPLHMPAQEVPNQFQILKQWSSSSAPLPNLFQRMQGVSWFRTSADCSLSLFDSDSMNPSLTHFPFYGGVSDMNREFCFSFQQRCYYFRFPASAIVYFLQLGHGCSSKASGEEYIPSGLGVPKFRQPVKVNFVSKINTMLLASIFKLYLLHT